MNYSSFILCAILSMAHADDLIQQHSLPDSVAGLMLDTPLQKEASMELVDQLTGALAKPSKTFVIIHLSNDSVARSKANGMVTAPGQVKKEAQAQQQSFLEAVLAADPDAAVHAKLQVLLNAVIVKVNTAVLDELGGHPEVVRIAPVGNYELDLSETVPYIIEATKVQDLGFNGTGVTVAVLDSGIDYTHANLGGQGTVGAYDDAYEEPASRDKLFPTAKVVDGYDFVGELWPGDLLMPDDDPIDFKGHGTHVADIIAGKKGVAPGAALVAVKVCSAVDNTCSGIALIQGMEFAVDPNGDGDPEDGVDIINISLSSNYGQPFDDDLSAAVNHASLLGVLTVSSAGNSGDKPYATGTPSSAETALSVAQTQVPSAQMGQILEGDGISDIIAKFQKWSVNPTSTIVGQVQYGDGEGGNLDGCATFQGDESLSGKIVLVDRGVCAFTLKISHISQAGGLVGIIGLVASGAPFSGGDGGDLSIVIPGYMISQDDATVIKESIEESISFSMTVNPLNNIPLVGSMVGSSSRGPQHESTHLIKPEIGAPGASVSAIVGTGTGEGPFSGTSGAAPMVAGSAALLLSAKPTLTPIEVKALLMNNGETDIDTDLELGLAPITRIGGGEVRVGRALIAPAAAWDDDVAQGALSFGFHDVHKKTLVLHKTVRVRNYSNEKIMYRILTTFRFQDDESNAAVSLDAPKKVTIPAFRDATFQVKLTINGALLRNNYMNSGSEGANPSALTKNEYDGYVILDDGNHPIHLAWHILPRKAANVVGRSVLTFSGGQDEVQLTNNGVGTAQLNAFALLATSENVPEGGVGMRMPTPDIRAVGVNTFPVPADICSDQISFVWAFAIHTWERQQHLVPVSHQVWLDTNQDGNPDYVVQNRDISLNDISDGRQNSFVVDLSTGLANAFFFAEHSMNTGNTVLCICAEQIGLTGDDIQSKNVDMFVVARDFYYGGPSDMVENITVTPLGEQYLGLPADIAPGMTVNMSIVDNGPFPGNTREKGLLLFTNGDRGDGFRGGATQETEALLLTNDPPKENAAVGAAKKCGSVGTKKKCTKASHGCEWDDTNYGPARCVDSPDDISALFSNVKGDDVKVNPESGCTASTISAWSFVTAVVLWFHFL